VKVDFTHDIILLQEKMRGGANTVPDP
jgi:hypothetical protein